MANVGSAEGKVSIDASGATSGAAEANKAFDSVGTGAAKNEKIVSKAGKDQADNYDNASKKVKQSSDYTGKAWVDAGQKATTLATSAYILYDSYDGVQQAQTAASKAALVLSRANENVEKTQTAYNDAVTKYGADSPQAIQAANDLAQAQDASAIAAERAEMATGNVDDAMAQFALGGLSGVLGMISGGAGLVQSLSGLSDLHFPKFGKAIDGVGTTLKTAGGSLLTNPIFIIATAIALVAVLIITNWDKIKPYFEWLWNTLKGIFESAWNFIDKNIIQPLVGAWNWIASAAGEMKKKLEEIWNGIYTFILGIWNWIDKNIIQPIIAGWNSVQSFANDMKTKLTEIWQGIYDFILGIWNWMDKNIITPITDAWDTITGAAEDMKKGVEDVWNGIWDTIKKVVGWILDKIQPLIDAFNTVGGFVDDIAGGVGDVVGGIGDFFGLSEGGVVRARPGGVPVIVAEGGEDEYVIPASKMGAVSRAIVGGSMGTMTAGTPVMSRALTNISSNSSRSYGNLNFYVQAANDPQTTAKQIYYMLKSKGLTY